jgi:hypothetical protein
MLKQSTFLCGVFLLASSQNLSAQTAAPQDRTGFGPWQAYAGAGALTGAAIFLKILTDGNSHDVTTHSLSREPDMTPKGGPINRGDTNSDGSPPVTTTPEPETLVLLATGIAGLGITLRRRRRQR